MYVTLSLCYAVTLTMSLCHVVTLTMCRTILHRRLPDGIRVFKSPHSVTLPVVARPSTNVFDSLRFTSENNVLSHIKQAQVNGNHKASKQNAAKAAVKNGAKGSKGKKTAGASGGTSTQAQTPTLAPAPAPAQTPGVANNTKDRKSQSPPK